jgi:hypothetical protein
LAEGEELGSNLLRVGQRTLTNAFVVVAQSSAHPLPFYHLIGAESGHYSILSEFLKGAMNGPLVPELQNADRKNPSRCFSCPISGRRQSYGKQTSFDHLIGAHKQAGRNCKT